MTRDEEVKYAFAQLYHTTENALNALMAKVDARARAEEREACAKLAEDGLYTDMNDKEMDLGPMIHVNPEIRRIVFHIRARGQQ